MKITITEYLSSKGIQFSTAWKELTTHCIFNDCDGNSHGKEAHLYIDSETGCYQCKKCLEQGNIITLMKHFWDDPKEYEIEGYNSPEKKELIDTIKKSITITEKDVEKYHKALSTNIRNYLNDRGISNETISERKIGYGSFYGANWIVIPIRDCDGSLLFFKLRRDPSKQEWNKYMFFPIGASAVLYGSENLSNGDDSIVICEGEFDQMMLLQHGVTAVTSTAWAGTFKSEWLDGFWNFQKVYIAFDNDDSGKKWSERLSGMIKARYPEKEVYLTCIPESYGKDITDYFQKKWTVDDLMGLYSESARGIDVSKFPSLKWEDIIQLLWLTIKHDDINKLVVFLAMLSAYTEDAQINILLNAPSSSGKSYIPLEIAKLFPEESVMKLLYVSQSAFFHENGEYDKEKNEKHIRLDRKIIIFIDQPRTELLARFRPLLSHDEKVMICKITDKTWQWGNKTKNIVIHGYPVAIFCTASTGLDEQEATRFLLLSPETHSEKIHDTIHSKIQSESIESEYLESIENNPERLLFKERIEMIKDARIEYIRISNSDEVERRFLEDKKYLKPRHQRDVWRFMSFIKTFALLNLPHRKRVGSTLYTEKEDLEEAWKIWESLAPGQEYNISPYAMQIYKDVFIPAYKEFNQSRKIEKDPFDNDELKWVPRRYILKKHSEIYGRPLSDATWRQEIEPTLENAGLITKETIGKTICLSPVEEMEI